MHEIRLVNRKICQKWKVELITKATPINYRKRHTPFERENYCKQQNGLIESPTKEFFPKSDIGHGWRWWVLILMTIPFMSPNFMQFHCLDQWFYKYFFLFSELLAWGLLTVWFFKKIFCCLFYIKVQLKIWSLKFSSCLILFLEISKSEHFSHFVMFSI